MHAASLSASKDKKPKVTPPDLREQLVQSTNEVIPQSSDGLARLQLQKETEALQIERLQLELQLAQLKLQDTQPNREKADKQPGEKSLGDLKAPQKIIAPQEWPHIFAPGEPKLFHELTITDFSAGYAVILKNCQDLLLRSHLLDHFYNLMVLAGSYKWSAVRAFHYKVLRSIEMGLASWGDSFDSVKQAFFLPSALLPEPASKTSAKQQQPKQPLNHPQQIPRNQICDAWSWFDDCNTPDCPLRHVCVVCKHDHQALNCTKRKYPIPSRRSEAPPHE